LATFLLSYRFYQTENLDLSSSFALENENRKEAWIMAINLDFIENPQDMEVVVSGPGDANRLFICTGIVVFNFKGSGGSWRHDTLTFQIGRTFTSSQFRKVVAAASLASISNNDHAVNAGWAVDRVEAKRASNGKTEVKMNLAIRDVDGYVHRVAYEVNVLAKL
jgi:hypothetical protein